MLGFGDRLANCYGKFTILFAPYCCYVTLHHYTTTPLYFALCTVYAEKIVPSWA